MKGETGSQKECGRGRKECRERQISEGRSRRYIEGRDRRQCNERQRGVHGATGSVGREGDV